MPRSNQCCLRRREKTRPSPSFEGDLSTDHLSAPDARYLVAKLVLPGDALCRPLLPELYEPVLISIGNGLMVLRGFESG